MVRSSGFTLIELVIVVVLLGILSAVAMPKFFDVSVDARRASNNATTTALNSGVAAVASRARVVSNIITNITVASANASTQTPIVVNLDNNSALTLNNYVGLASTSLLIPVGGGTGASGTTDLSLTTSGATPYVDILAGNASIITGCMNLFNVLISDNSVQAGNANVNKTTAAYQVIDIVSPAESTPFTLINSTTGSTFSSGSITAGILPVAKLGTGGVAGSWGGCLYLMNSSSSSSTKFYIIYDLSKGAFYSAESSILGS